MTAHAKVGGVWKTLDGLYVKVGGVWKTISNGYVKVAGVWEEFYTTEDESSSGDLVINSVTPSPCTGSKTGGFAASATVYSDTVAVSVSGGSGAYHYSWVRLSAPSSFDPFIITDRQDPSPFWYARVPNGSPKSETWRLSVGSGGFVATYDLTVTLSFNSFL